MRNLKLDIDKGFIISNGKFYKYNENMLFYVQHRSRNSSAYRTLKVFSGDQAANAIFEFSLLSVEPGEKKRLHIPNIGFNRYEYASLRFSQPSFSK